MTFADFNSPVADPPLARSAAEGHPWIAWAVILAVMAWLILRRDARDPLQVNDAGNRLQAVAVDVQLRYLVGAAKTLPQQDSSMLASAAPVDHGPIDERLRAVAAVGELAGTKEALDKLTALEKPLADQTVLPEQKAIADLLARLYSDLVDDKPALPSLKPADRDLLVKRLGWSGRLALHPAGCPDEAEREELLAQAKQTFVGLLVLFVIALLMVVAGLAAFAAIVLLLTSRPQSRAMWPASEHGGIYAETFAIWMVGYIALSRAAQSIPVGQNYFLLIAVVMIVSMSALAWPLARGVPWRTVRDDLGLNLGRRPLLELLVGPLAYLAGISLAVVGLVVVLLAMAVVRHLTGAGEHADNGGLAYHPIAGAVFDTNWWQKLQILFLAGVMAPLMEESLFRGALHRHLRDAMHRLGYLGSLLVSAITGAFVFAAIHPQGWFAVPALMGLAVGFTLAREWRGTLLPAMIAHGLNNTLLMCVLISLAG